MQVPKSSSEIPSKSREKPLGGVRENDRTTLRTAQECAPNYLRSAAFGRAFVGELLCSVMCIELGAFLIVSTRPDDQRPPVHEPSSSVSYTRPKQTPSRRARGLVLGGGARNLFRMNDFEASRTNSAKRRNTTVPTRTRRALWPARRDERMTTTSAQSNKPTSRGARRRRRCFSDRGASWC